MNREMTLEDFQNMRMSICREIQDILRDFEMTTGMSIDEVMIERAVPRSVVYYHRQESDIARAVLEPTPFVVTIKV